MSAVLRLKQLIADLDNAARRELTAAAADGRFDDVSELTPIAKEVAALANRCSIENHPSESVAVGENQVVHQECTATVSSDSRLSPEIFGKADCPQFLREKAELVKLGWSAIKEGTYEHRVHEEIVHTISAIVASKGKAGHRFTMNEILESLSAEKNSKQIPSYQVYAVVLWLKWAGMVLQHGRQGYTVIRPQTFASSLETAWQSLPQR